MLCSRSYLENQLSVALGGRVAEELIFGVENVTTGASNDFQQVCRQHPACSSAAEHIPALLTSHQVVIGSSGLAQPSKPCPTTFCPLLDSTPPTCQMHTPAA